MKYITDFINYIIDVQKSVDDIIDKEGNDIQKEFILEKWRDIVKEFYSFLFRKFYKMYKIL